MSTSPATAPARTDWSLIWAAPGFRYFFFAMFISLFGSGMNFAGVSWHILALTHSTVKVSYQVIVATAPGLLIPFIGGVLIDRYDRRYLGMALDLARGIAVLATAYVAWRGHLELWHLYLVTLITGTDKLAGGYLVSDGTLGELVVGTRHVVERRSGAPMHVVLDAEDDRGRTLHAEGQVRTALRWLGWPGRLTFWTLTDWRWDGVQGWGEDQEFFAREQVRSLIGVS